MYTVSAGAVRGLGRGFEALSCLPLASAEAAGATQCRRPSSRSPGARPAAVWTPFVAAMAAQPGETRREGQAGAGEGFAAAEMRKAVAREHAVDPWVEGLCSQVSQVWLHQVWRCIERRDLHTRARGCARGGCVGRRSDRRRVCAFRAAECHGVRHEIWGAQHSPRFASVCVASPLR